MTRNRLHSERALAESRIERNGIKAGTRAPAFTLPDIGGGSVSLNDYRGRRVLLVFSDPDCGPCDALAPELVRLAAEQPSLQVLVVSRGDREANRAKACAAGFTFPVVLQDGWKLSKEYGIFATPVAFLIDELGFVAKPVAIGADQIQAVAEGRGVRGPSRWQAIAAAFAAMFALPRQARAQAGLVNCLGTPTNIVTDPKNCGACGNVCPSGWVCVSGQCQAPPGWKPTPSPTPSPKPTPSPRPTSTERSTTTFRREASPTPTPTPSPSPSPRR